MLEKIVFNLNGTVRRITEGGVDYYVVPMTTITPDGVLPGSKGALLYPRQETYNSVADWDSTPIVVYHPERNGQHCSAADVPEKHIGQLRNSEFDASKGLQHEGWIDVAKLRKADRWLAHNGRPQIEPSIVNGQPVEVSTGLYTTNLPAANGYAMSPKGRPYTAVATDFRPDHLAILPDQVGACSVNDGCGLLVNERRKANYIVNPAVSEAQRRYLNSQFGHPWVKEHGFDNRGELPEYIGDDDEETENSWTDHDTARMVHMSELRDATSNAHANQYTHGDAKKAAHALSAKANKSGAAVDHLAAADAHLAVARPGDGGEHMAAAKAHIKVVKGMTSNSWWRQLGEKLGIVNAKERHHHNGQFSQTAKGAAYSGFGNDEPRGIGANRPDDDGRDTMLGHREDIDLDGDGDGPVDDDAWRKQDEEAEHTVPPPKQPANNRKKEECPECGGEMEEDEDGDMRCEECGHEEDDATENTNPKGVNQYTHGGAAELHEAAAKAHDIAASSQGGSLTVEADRATNKARKATDALSGAESELGQKVQKASYSSYKAGQSKKNADNARGPQAAQSAMRSWKNNHEEAAAGHRELAEAHRKADRGTANSAEQWITYNRNWPQSKRDKLDAKSFAGPDQSFPIATQADVDAAMHSVGRTKHDPEAIKAGIRRIARRKGLSVNWDKQPKQPKPVQQPASSSAAAYDEKTKLMGGGMVTNEDCPDCGKQMKGGKCECGYTGNVLSVTTPPAPVGGGMVMGQDSGQNPMAHAASQQAAIASMDHPPARDKAISAFDHSAAGRSPKAATRHDEAADAHDDAAQDSYTKGDVAGGDSHANAAMLHRKASAMHSVDKTVNNVRTFNMKAIERLTPEQRAKRLTALRPRMLKVLTTNCSCKTERQALNGLNNETLAILVNAKQQGSNADTQGSGDFDDAEIAGGWDKSRVKGDDETFYDSDDEGKADETEDDAEDEPINTGGGTDKTRGRVGVGNRGYTREQWMAMAPPEVREEHEMVGNILLQQKTRLIRQLVGHLPPKRQDYIVNSMGLLKKSLNELRSMTMFQQPRQEVANAYAETTVPEPLYLGANDVPTGNERVTENADQNDVACLVPPTINFRQWAEEDRLAANGGHGVGYNRGADSAMRKEHLSAESAM